MKRKSVMAVLVIALAAPVPAAAADGVDSMFGMMFRMMLTMMNLMSGAMLGNNNWGGNDWGGNNWGNNSGNGFGGLNSLNLGMSAFPMMSGFGSPWNSFGGSSPWGGMSPWSGMSPGMGMSPWSGMSPGMGMSPWSGMSPGMGMPPWSGMSPGMGMSPWSGMSPGMGMSPWSGMSPGMGMSPWSTMSPWNSSGMSPWSSGGGNPFGGGFPGYSPAMQPDGYYPPYGGYDGSSGYGPHQPGYGNAPPAAYPAGSIIDGRWYGSSGEILEIRGNRFRLQSGQVGLEGAITVENDIISMFSPQTNSVTRYTFMRNQTGLLLQGVNGEVLRFTQNPVNGVVHVF